MVKKRGRKEKQVEIEGRDLISIIVLCVTTIKHLSLLIQTFHAFFRLT